MNPYCILTVPEEPITNNSGDVDILLEIVAGDMQHLSDIVLKDLFDTEGVMSTSSTFVLDEVKSLH